MLLNNRVDMNTHMYSMPLPTFDQTEFIYDNLSGSAPQQLVLSGFRSGMVKKIQVWCVQKTNSGDSSFVVNPLYWQLPQSVEILYMGLKYATYLNKSSQIWNLVDGTSPAAADTSVLTYNGGTGFNSTAKLSQWIEAPFSQPSGADYEALVMTYGKEILNGICNMSIVLPDATNTYDVHVAYVYSASVSFSHSTAEITF